MTRTTLPFLRILLLWLAALLAVPAIAQTPTNITPQLIAEHGAPAPGGTTTLALLMTPKPTWHGYWKNGGDAGFGLTVEWNLPEGVTVMLIENGYPSSENTPQLVHTPFWKKYLPSNRVGGIRAEQFPFNRLGRTSEYTSLTSSHSSLTPTKPKP